MAITRKYPARQFLGFEKGQAVKVVVDGEIHDGEVTGQVGDKLQVKIPFYYFHSAKHGAAVSNPHLTILEDPALVM